MNRQVCCTLPHRASLLFWEFSLHRWQEKAFWLMRQSRNDLCMRRELSILHSIFNHLIKYRTSPMTAIHHFHLKAFRKAASPMQGLNARLRLQLINWLRFVNGVSYKVLSTATSFRSFQVIISWLIKRSGFESTHCANTIIGICITGRYPFCGGTRGTR